MTNIQLNSALLVTYVDLLFWVMLKALWLRMKVSEKLERYVFFFLKFYLFLLFTEV